MSALCRQQHNKLGLGVGKEEERMSSKRMEQKETDKLTRTLDSNMPVEFFNIIRDVESNMDLTNID